MSKPKSIILLAAVAGLAFAAPGPVPAPWTSQDIGAPMAGNSTYDPVPDPMAWSVTGSGGDIWGTSDQFHFAAMPVTGDFTISARVGSLTSGTLNEWAKAGVMARDTNAANSMYAFEHITGNQGTDFQFRTTTGGGAANNGQTGAAALHRWVRVQRVGNAFTGSWSDNGTTWTAHGAAQTIAMGATILVGLANTSHNNAVTATASLDNVTITNGSGVVIWPLAPPTGLSGTPGVNSVALTWTASVSAATTGYTILRGTTNGGPYPTTVGTTAGTNFTDNTAANPNTYYYVVVATAPTIGRSGYSNQTAAITPLPPPVVATPTSGLQTNESPTTTTFTVRFNQAAPAAGSMVTVTSNDPGEGVVSSATNPTPATSIVINVGSGFTGDLPITVTGVGDSIVDGNITYTISVTATNMGVTIPDVSVTNNDTNVAGITFSRLSGLTTSESATTDQFSVTLNTQPFGFIDLPLTSLNTAEVSVSPATLRFTPSGSPTYNAGTGVGDWNVAHVVTLTGVDDAVLDFTIPFTIQTGTLQLSNASDSPAYAFDPSDVTGVNLDNEAIPTLPTVWGGGSNGGCGLTGLEVALLLGLAAWRRRRSA